MGTDPFEGPIKLRVDTKHDQVIGPAVAHTILICCLGEM
jgi:hypothetical protein